MYTEKENDFECRCGLKFDEIYFVDFRCIDCYVDDYDLTCRECGYKGHHEEFTNYLCEACEERDVL